MCSPYLVSIHSNPFLNFPKLSIQPNPTLLANLKEADNLLIQLKVGNQETETCWVSYLGQTDGILHVRMNSDPVFSLNHGIKLNDSMLVKHEHVLAIVKGQPYETLPRAV